MDKIKKGQQSLFSIQVDDVVIQRIFAGLQNEVAELQKEVNALREDVKTKPTRAEVDQLLKSMDELKMNHTTFAADIQDQVNNFNRDFVTQLTETQNFAKKEITDAVFSLNNVVRAQNALIEEKIFELTKPSFEFSEMKQTVASIRSSHEILLKEMDKMKDTVARVLEVRSFNDVSDLNLTKVIRNATQDDRDSISHAVMRLDSLTTRIESAEQIMVKICRNPNVSLPQWQTVPKYEIKNKPKLPQITAGTTFYEYLDYLMLLAPSIQKVLTGFYKEITSLSNRIWEAKGTTETVQAPSFNEEAIKNLINDVDELKLKAVSRAELNELQEEVQSIKGTDVPKLKLNKLTNEVELLSAKVANFDSIDQKIESLQKNFDTAISSAIREVQSAVVSPGITPRYKDLPAKTSVTPRGKQAHNLLFGELPPATSQHQPPRQAETRLERKPSIVTKPTIRRNDSSLN